MTNNNNTLRRGQHLLNTVYFKLAKAGYAQSLENIENEIWNMSDTEFYEIINMSDQEAVEFYNNK